MPNIPLTPHQRFALSALFLSPLLSNKTRLESKVFNAARRAFCLTKPMMCIVRQDAMHAEIAQCDSAGSTFVTDPDIDYILGTISVLPHNGAQSMILDPLYTILEDYKLHSKLYPCDLLPPINEESENWNAEDEDESPKSPGDSNGN